MRRRAVIAIALGLGAIAAVVFAGGPSASPPHPLAVAASDGVVVVRRSIPAGRSVRPEDLEIRQVADAIRPHGALTTVEQALYREAVVALPVGMPLVPSVLRTPAALSLAPGERAVGVRVDDVTGLPNLLDTGSVVDVVVAGADPFRIDAARVLARPRRSVDGGSWAVALRLPARLAERVGVAASAGLDIRLLPRSEAP